MTILIPERVLLGPGPSNVPPRVLAAMSRPTIGHLDPVFVSLMDEVKTMLRVCFQTQNAVTFPISGPGTAGMEACFANLIEPGDKVLICRNGVFGDRMRQMTGRLGGNALVLDFEWGKAVDAAEVENVLKTEGDIKLVAVVHAETSTGVLSDVAAVCAAARSHGALTIVDCVTSLGGVPVEVDRWQADAVYSGTQKCLSCPPGLSPVTFSHRAIEHVKARRTKVVSWFYDLGLLTGYWQGEGARSYHHTAPINMIYALHEALKCLLEESLAAAWQRHRDTQTTLISGLQDLGLGLPVAEDIRLPQLTLVNIPSGVNDAAFRARLLNDFDLEIGGGLGKFAGQAWRIGLMGHGSTRGNAELCVRRVRQCLTAIQ